MITKRIIPCLDVTGGKVVKGVNFVNLIDAGDPVECAAEYDKQGADEIVFLDITATSDSKKTVIDMVKKTAEKVFVPFTVGGGIREVADFREVLRAGADKVSINSQAVKNPKLIEEASDVFGSQCVVVAVDVKKNKLGNYNVFVAGGRIDTGLDALSWIEKATKLGAGEILLTSMDADGTKNGFDIEITKKVAEMIDVPVIASGGCGKLEHFLEVFQKTKASAALAASLFHFGELTVGQVKEYLNKNDILVRL